MSSLLSTKPIRLVHVRDTEQRARFRSLIRALVEGRTTDAIDLVILDPELMRIIDADGWSAFLVACERGNVEFCSYTRHHGFANTVYANAVGDTPTICAVVSGNIDMVIWLFEHGLLSLHSNALGESPLSFAPAPRETDRVKGKITREAEQRLKDADNKIKSLLKSITEAVRLCRKACDTGDVIRLRNNLYGHNCLATTVYADGKSLIDYASDVESTPLVRDHLRHLPPADERAFRVEALTATDQRLYTDLLAVCERGDLKAFKLVFARSSDPMEQPRHVARAVNDQRVTPLQMAVKSGCVELADYIYKQLYGDVVPCDRNSNTYLHLATAGGHAAMCQWLLDRRLIGAASAANATKRTAFALAATGGHLTTLRWLIEHDLASDEPGLDGATPFLLACAAGSTECVRYLHAAGHATGRPNTRGETPLHVAVASKQLPLVELLLSAGMANVLPDRENTTPFVTAIRTGGVEMAAMLCRAGAGSADADHRGDTPTHYACTLNSLELLMMLWDFNLVTLGANKAGQNPIQHGQSRSVGYDRSGARVFLDRIVAQIDQIITPQNVRTAPASPRKAGSLPMEAEMHLRSLSTEDNLLRLASVINSAGADLYAHGQTPLQVAARAGYASAVEQLVTMGVHVDVEGLSKQALALAVEKGHMAVVQLLLAAGADPEMLDAKQRRPLDLASKTTVTEMTRIFEAEYANASLRAACRSNDSARLFDVLSSGSEPSLGPSGPGDRSALHIAAMCGSVGVLCMLLNRPAGKALINSRDAAGNTPLHLAAMHSGSETVYVLLEGGSNPVLVNTLQQTPADCARAAGNYPLERTIRARGLVSAARAAHESGASVDVPALVEMGAAVDAADSSCRTALHYACLANNLDLVRALVGVGASLTVKSAMGEVPADLATDQNVLSYLRYIPSAATPAQRTAAVSQAMTKVTEAAAGVAPAIVAENAVASLKVRILPTSVPHTVGAAMLKQQVAAVESWLERQMTVSRVLGGNLDQKSLGKFAKALFKALEASRGVHSAALGGFTRSELKYLVTLGNTVPGNANLIPVRTDKAIECFAVQIPILLIEMGLSLLADEVKTPTFAADILTVSRLSGCGVIYYPDYTIYREALIRLVARATAALALSTVPAKAISRATKTAADMLDISEAGLTASNIADIAGLGISAAVNDAYGTGTEPVAGRGGHTLEDWDEVRQIPDFDDLYVGEHPGGTQILRSIPADVVKTEVAWQLRTGMGAPSVHLFRLCDIVKGKARGQKRRMTAAVYDAPPRFIGHHDPLPWSALRTTPDRTAALLGAAIGLAQLHAAGHRHCEISPECLLAWVKGDMVSASLLTPLPVASEEERLEVAKMDEFLVPYVDPNANAPSEGADVYALARTCQLAWPSLAGAKDARARALADLLDACTGPASRRPPLASLVTTLSLMADVGQGITTWRGSRLPAQVLGVSDWQRAAVVGLVKELAPQVDVAGVWRLENAVAAAAWQGEVVEASHATQVEFKHKYTSYETLLGFCAESGAISLPSFMPLPSQQNQAGAALAVITYAKEPMTAFTRYSAPFGRGVYTSLSPAGLAGAGRVARPVLLCRTALGAAPATVAPGCPQLRPRCGGGHHLPEWPVGATALCVDGGLVGGGDMVVVPAARCLPEYVIMVIEKER